MLSTSFLRSPWLRPLNDVSAVDDLLGLVVPTWSLTRCRARVLAAIREAPDVRTLVLRPNRLWPGHRAGQHVGVEVEVDGRRLRRTFSLSSAPRRDGLVSITVKRRPDGRVSAWWNDRAAVGDVVTLDDPAGDFVLPDPLPPRVVLVSAGSGITPTMAMLGELGAGGGGCDVLFVHGTRGPAIFAAELDRLERRHSWLETRIHDSTRGERLGPESLRDLAREAGDAPVFACGPADFVAALRTALAAEGRDANLRVESFGVPLRAGGGGSQPVTASAAGRTFPAAGGQPLLDAAEAAGLRPAYGCRLGVCHTCKCRKVSGVVEDLRDGRLLSEPGETIQLCVTAARSAVVLDL